MRYPPPVSTGDRSLEDLATDEDHKPTMGLDPATVAELNRRAEAHESAATEKGDGGSRLILALVLGVVGLAAALAAVALFVPDGADPPQARRAALPDSMAAVAAGEYAIGCNDGAADCFPDESPSREASLGRFALMKDEVTAAQYAVCVGAGRCKPAGEGPGCSPEGAPAPVNCVRWSDAQDYCAYKGLRLPEEAEWEAAARGPKSLDYPWGALPPTCERTVLKGCGGDRPPGIGAKAEDVSWAGVRDLGGGVSEWTATKYEAYPGGERYGDATGRVHRGGAWNLSSGTFPTAHGRAALPPDSRRPGLGFRCAKSL